MRRDFGEEGAHFRLPVNFVLFLLILYPCVTTCVYPNIECNGSPIHLPSCQTNVCRLPQHKLTLLSLNFFHVSFGSAVKSVNRNSANRKISINFPHTYVVNILEIHVDDLLHKAT